MDTIFDVWKTQSITELKTIDRGSKPKDIIAELAHRLLASYDDRDLIDKYDIYQYLMTYWNETMQDDCYIIAFDGWVARTHRVIEIKKKKEVDKGWDCDLVPKDLVINRYFKDEQNALNGLEEEKETIETQLTDMEEEHSGEDGCFSDLDKVNKGNINARLKELKLEEDADEDIEVFTSYLNLMDNLTKAKKSIKTATEKLDSLLYTKYPTLTSDEVKTLVVDDKWMATIDNDISNEIDQISQKLSNRIKELAERYENTLPELDVEAEELEQKVNDHLKKMGFEW